MHAAIRTDHVAVITGGASGIGRATAVKLAEAGMRLVLADVDQDELTVTAETLRASGAVVEALVVDVSDPVAIASLAAAAHALGPVSILMNNAGREGGGGILGGAKVWNATIATNLLGPVYGTQAFLPAMLDADWPCALVNTGSKQGITLPPGDTAYNVSKAGLNAFTASLAHDLLPTAGRITAHLLIPGFTFTGFTTRRGIDAKPDGAWTAEQVVDYLLEGMARGDFYILCPDNETARETDVRRIRWSAADIIENRPALSRWNPAYADAFAAHMRGDTD